MGETLMIEKETEEKEIEATAAKSSEDIELSSSTSPFFSTLPSSLTSPSTSYQTFPHAPNIKNSSSICNSSSIHHHRNMNNFISPTKKKVLKDYQLDCVPSLFSTLSYTNKNENTISYCLTSSTDTDKEEEISDRKIDKERHLVTSSLEDVREKQRILMNVESDKGKEEERREEINENVKVNNETTSKE